MFGTGFDDKGRGAHEPLEMRTLFQSNGAGARDLTAGLAVDAGTVGNHGVEKFDARTALDAELATPDLTDDFAMTADDQIPGTIHRAAKLAKDGKVVALDAAS